MVVNLMNNLSMHYSYKTCFGNMIELTVIFIWGRKLLQLSY
jgi:hypothetical protein